jgi:RHH-type transcriptional regulator, rel operon repressor / antitoxin RelB
MATSIQLTPELESRLDRLAEKTGRPKGFYLQEALENAIEDLEDYYSAEEVLRRVRSGQEETYSSAEVRRELGLDD